MAEEHMARRWVYAGLFLISLCVLCYEILLTRIFSVVMWYHFAFMAISVAMFGMTVGSVSVYLLPAYFRQDRTKHHLALSTLLFAVSIPLSFMTQQCIPFTFNTSTTIISWYSIALTYLVVAAPFFLSGVCICLALTRFPLQVSSLYAADLVGAAAGCVLSVVILNTTDGPTAVLAVAAVAGLAAACFAMELSSGRIRRVSVIVFLVLGAFSAAHTALVYAQQPLFRLFWVRGQLEERPLYEKWNSHSRITVKPVDQRAVLGPTISMSPTWKPKKPIHQKRIWIDVNAGTPMTEYRGDPSEVDFLKYCLTSTAHYLRSDADVCIIGVGGGKDVLAALTFDQKSVLGLEVNSVIYDVLTNRFGDFTGHLDQDPKVTLINEEARSYLGRTDEQFDIITMSFVDSFAATAAGAYVMAENTLYTLEAWQTFLERLRPGGVLTATRFHFRDNPLQMYRLVALASAALKEIGAEDPRRHIAVLSRNWGWQERRNMTDIGIILVSNQPFSERDIDTLERHAERMQFDLILSPRYAADADFAAVAAGDEPAEALGRYPVDLSPPTDDSPFFFNVLKIRKALGWEPFEQPFMSANVRGVRLLAIVLVIVAVLTFLCIVVPLMITVRTAPVTSALPFLFFFAAIGCGFMLIEIAQMQRLIVFLGHPTYALVVVLSVLLLASGLGSLSTRRLAPGKSAGASLIRLAILLGVLVVFGVTTPHALAALHVAKTPVRILAAVVILFPLGFVMGMPLPLGMKDACAKTPALAPWFWGINGATSVLASVLAVAISLDSGITATFWAGFLCYVVAVGSFAWQTRIRPAG